MSAQRIDLLIFDLDGVLVESEVAVSRALAAMLATIGVEVEGEAIIRRFHYWPFPRIVEALAAEQGVRVPDGFVEGLRRAYVESVDEMVAVSGAAAALEQLALAKCIASGSRPENLRRKLEVTGLLHHFEPHLFSAFDVGRPKPAPDVFLHAAERLGVAPGNCLVIEDAVVGIEAARSAGMHALGFCGAEHCHDGWEAALRQAGAHDVIGDLGHLPGYITGLGGRVA